MHPSHLLLSPNESEGAARFRAGRWGSYPRPWEEHLMFRALLRKISSLKTDWDSEPCWNDFAQNRPRAPTCALFVCVCVCVAPHPFLQNDCLVVLFPRKQVTVDKYNYEGHHTHSPAGGSFDSEEWGYAALRSGCQTVWFSTASLCSHSQFRWFSASLK